MADNVGFHLLGCHNLFVKHVMYMYVDVRVVLVVRFVGCVGRRMEN